MSIATSVFAAALITAFTGSPSIPKRALLIGIDDYSASKIAQQAPASQEKRGWSTLRGPVRDVRLLSEMLKERYGFAESDIVVLTDQKATRDAILQKIDEHLVRPAVSGGIVLFYFAGHGSQVPNSLSEEPDQLDESIIPADSRAGAPDIRDKELRPLFNRILDRGAHLTIVLDNCHSGSGARGYPNGARPRGIRPASNDVRDRTRYGPSPDARDALIFAASQDGDLSWEVQDENGAYHGAFTWSWIRAMRDAAPGESGEEIFFRTQARLRAETPYQQPVLAGTAAARSRSFLGSVARRRSENPVVAIERINDADGTVTLQAGWAHGYSVGSELRIAGEASSAPQLRITSLLGISRSVAKILKPSPAIRTGALCEVVAWSAPPVRRLRVHAPRSESSVEARATRFREAAATRGLHWVTDPIADLPAYVLRPAANGWELLASDGTITAIESDRAAIDVLSTMPRRAAVFVQFPIPSAVHDALDLLPQDGIDLVDRPEVADVILAGRFANRRLEFAWIRPLVGRNAHLQGGLPAHSAWQSTRGKAPSAVGRQLGRLALTLRRIHGWNHLESPSGSRPPYSLAFRRSADGRRVENAILVGESTYVVELQSTRQLPAQVTHRYYYVFMIDSRGMSFLAFPRYQTGSVENRFPIKETPPSEILLGDPSKFTVREPYGTDTWFLLTTEEPLANLSVLEWDGVRAPRWETPLSPLEELFAETSCPSREHSGKATVNWSIERLVVQSVPPK